MNDLPQQDKEITAMAAIAGALASFTDGEHAVIERVLRWAADRYGCEDTGKGSPSKKERIRPSSDDEDEREQESRFKDPADLFGAFGPTTPAEKALVVGYWFQSVKQQREFTSHQVNGSLKHLGHRVGNITDVLGSLIAREPSLVIQTKKRGTTRQARKNYKLTAEGIRVVEERIREAATEQL